MEWTAEHNVTFGREVLAVNPFKHKKGSVERGTAWKQIASNLNASSNVKFAVSQRSVRDHLILLQKKYRKMRQEEQASGISPEKTERDVLIEEINDMEEMADAEHQEAGRVQQEKADQDKMKAEDMRKKAMETLGETKKRQAQDEKENKNKRKRRSGSDTIEYLKEKYNKEHKMKEEELELKRKMHEFEMKKHKSSLEKHQESSNQQAILMQRLHEQQHQVQQQQQFQQQMGNFQMMMIQSQQQQQKAMFDFFEKLQNKN